ncbi:DUF6603 domain-containing protein [Serinibacter salmoneus]|uniref:Outer membrane protein OmpA-like peptidoglycan-associated protein n=1 Tax=Serinibacter salmoneus TaxID=556530 RepID=A0A2A9D084_9MICO|nr:DUF6603 domain-containing protein [Serinibacter salmoneus]PFG19801.1 outer membrane protein OmpA-like peptidoglycan-associated protein [Serinibacter salmoneus]
MPSLWDDLPASLRDGDLLEGLRGPLEAVDTTGLTPREVTEDGATWRVREVVLDLAGASGGLIDAATGRIGGDGGATPVELLGTDVTLSLAERLTGPGGSADGAWRLDLDVPGVSIHLPFLTGARLGTQGVLEPDPAREQVRLLLPRLVTRLHQEPGAGVGFSFVSATTGGDPVDDVYELLEMSPPHALIGPGSGVGFAFRTAVLDLSGDSGPEGVPAGARAMPAAWQGVYLPEVRLYVATPGMDDLAVSAGVRNLWIGLGAHAGVTGTFGAEVINTGGDPEILGRYVTPSGAHISATPGGEDLVPDGSLFVADSNGGLAPIALTLRVDGAPVAGDRTTLAVPASGTVSIEVTAASPGGTTAATFTARRAPAAPGSAPGGAPAARVTTLTPEGGRIMLVRQSAATATLALASGASATWTWPGGGTGAPAATAEVPLAVGEEVEVTATLTAAAPPALDAYLRYDTPEPHENTAAWSSVATHIRTIPATSRRAAPTGETFAALAGRSLAAFPGAVRVDGYASYEGDDAQATYNLELSRRRAESVARVLEAAGYTVTHPVLAHGHTHARDGIPVVPGESAAPPGSGHWWRVRVSATAGSAPPLRARLQRPAPAPVIDRDPAPARSGKPDCFRRLGLEVELLRGEFIRCELWGEFDIQTAAEAALDAGGQPPLGGRGPNPLDGVCAFRVRLRVAGDGGAWEVTAQFRALEGDIDGLLERSRGGSVNATALDAAGGFFVIGPLAAAVAELSPAAGALVQLGGIALGISDVFQTQRITLHGAELQISDGIIAPDGSRADSDAGAVALLLDVEVAFSFDFEIVSVPPDKPVRVRYQALGVKVGWEDGEVAVPVPVFDPDRGYELEIQPDSVRAVEPLDEILRIFGVRVSRDNPTMLEVEAGIGVELGPLTVDTLRVRANLGTGEFELTKLGVSLDIPGAVRGSGSFSFTEAGFRATIDVTIVPIEIRAAATLVIETVDGVTGVLVGIEVEFPVPILLGGSGLGIFGLMAGVGINMGRVENPHADLPALDWVMKQLGTPRGSVMHPDGWAHEPGAYALAAGILLGTLEGGYVVHLKGILMIELPGPRLLLILKADVLSAPPALGSEQSATFLAVLDVDFGAGTITLGVVADYSIDRILAIHVPVTAFFSRSQPDAWRVDLGSYHDRIRVEVLDTITASGYLMVHGDGIGADDVPADVLPGTTGLAIATGFHFSAVLMGSKPARLYVEVAAGFDAILGFDPFYLAGKIYIRGELMLFIASLGVSATLTIVVGKRIETDPGGTPREVDHPYIHGEVCGKISFFFFSVQACVSLTIGSEPEPDLVPPDLVADVALMGRGDVLLEGAGAGRSIEGILGRAATDGSAGPSVPLDAVVVISFTSAPEASGAAVLGGGAEGTTGVAGTSAWHRIGERWWAYLLKSVELIGDLGDGETPCVWWNDAVPTQTKAPPTLGLLTWRPEPYSSAITYGETLSGSVRRRWGHLCSPAAPAAPQLWTFDAQALGPSLSGWRLRGIVWPDEPGTVPRSAPAGRDLRVLEPWRTGREELDAPWDVQPGRVIGDLVPCEVTAREWQGPPAGTVQGSTTFTTAQASAHLAAGGRLHDLAALHQESQVDPRALGASVCPGRILQAPRHEGTDASPAATPAQAEIARKGRGELGWRPDPLVDAVELLAEEELISARILLLLPMERAPYVLQWRDEAGGVLEEHLVSDADRVSAARPIPDTWTDPGGPWRAPVGRSLRVASGLRSGNKLLAAYLVELEAHGAMRVVMGWAERHDQVPREAYLVAVEATTMAEARRAAWDTEVITRDREAFITGVERDPSGHALLVPGEAYTVRVTWWHDQAEGAERPTSPPEFTADTERTQEFRFTADPSDPVDPTDPEQLEHSCPRDLTPWLLDAEPGMGESGRFTHESVQIALSHTAVPELFAAYGRRLRVRVRSASGAHPLPPGGSAPGEALPIPLHGEDDPQSVRTVTVSSLHLGAWERAARDAASDLPCVPADVTRDLETLTIGYVLEPLTDYLLDIETVPEGGGGDVHRVFRANFTTSRFTGPDHLAQWVTGASREHRLVRVPAAVQALPTRPAGGAWDAAVQAAGLPVPQIPAAPRLQVWWSADAVPQPLAVVLDSSESLHRERLTPTLMQPPVDAADLSATWWGTQLRPWLHVEPGAETSAALVQDIVVAPGGNRIMVRLLPGGRGKRLHLELVRAGNPVAGTAATRHRIADLTLTAAPWEVED